MSEGKIRIWFNQTLSATYNIIEDLKQGSLGDRLEFITSSRRSNHAFLQLGDVSMREPEDYEGDYIEWLLNIGKENDVSILIPKRQLKLIAENKQRFEEQGIKVICNTAESIDITNYKSKTYEKLFDNFSEFIPEYRIVTNPDEMDIAIREYLRIYGTAVIKADNDEGGDTVRYVKEQIKSNHSTFMNGIPGARISRSEAVNSYRILLNKLEEDGIKCGKPFIVMPYLVGPEISVDCYIGKNMQEPIAIGRIKETGRSQYVGGIHEVTAKDGRKTTLEDLAIAIGKEIGLTEGIYNVQFMWDGRDSYKVTDVNPRTSGGMYMTLLTGINPVEYAIRDYMCDGIGDKIEYNNKVEKIHVGRVERAVVIR